MNIFGRYCSKVFCNLWNSNFIVFILFASAFFITIYFIIMMDNILLSTDSKVMFVLLTLDIISLILLTSMVSYKVINLWIRRKRKFIGSKLQSRMVLMFATVSAIPTIVIFIFSTLFFDYGIQSWFNEKIRVALNGSLSVAQGYLREHNRNIVSNAHDMAQSISSNAYLFNHWPKLLVRLMDEQVHLRDLTEALIFSNNNVIARSSLSFSVSLDKIPSINIDKVKDDGISVFVDEDSYKVMAVLRLNNVKDTYLLVTKLVDKDILQKIYDTKGAVNSYEHLEHKISSLQIQFLMLFAAVSLLLILASIWAGMVFAGGVVNPLIELINATKKVARGNFKSQVVERDKEEEITTLAVAFNQMTRRIEKQQNALLKANRDIDDRRIFIEQIISGISSGIIVIDQEYKILLYNDSTTKILLSKRISIGDVLSNIMPEMHRLVMKCKNNDHSTVQDQLFLKVGNKCFILLVKVVFIKGEEDGFIITFDDISDLVAAQKLIAWSDITKRIAHEIKNPITPINLAAERLQSKYADSIKEGKENFIKYTNTIIKTCFKY